MPRAASTSPWFVYIVRCADRTLYTGVTTEPERRVAEHNDGRGAKYTSRRCPVVLVYVEAAADRSAAQRRESEIKRMSSASKRRLVGGTCERAVATRRPGS